MQFRAERVASREPQLRDAVSAEGKGAPPGSLPALAQMVLSSVRAFYGPGALTADTLGGATC